MTKIHNTNVSAAAQVENKKVKKQQQKKEQQVFKGNGNKQTAQKPNDSAFKQEIYKKTGFQLKDTANRGKIIPLKVNGKIRNYETVGTLTTGGRILVKEQGKEVYHVVSHTKDNKLVMLKDDYAKKKIFYDSTSAEHKVKIGKKNYVITNSSRDRHGRMTAIDSRGQEVILSHDGKELKRGYVEAEDQKDNLEDYIAQQTKGKSKEEAAIIRQQILNGNSSYSNKGVLRFKASNGEVWYYDTKRKTYVKYAEKEAQAIIKNLDKGAKEDWGLFTTGAGTNYELLKNTNAQIIDPEVLNKINKHYSTEYGKKVDKNAEYGSGKYKTAYEAFLASEIGDDEVYLFNAALVKNNAITDQSRRNEILQTNLTKISGVGVEGLNIGVNKRANRMAAADAASTKEDYQALQDAAEEANKTKKYKAQFKGQDALQTYIYGVHDGDVQDVEDFNNALIDPKKDMLDKDEIVRIKAETGALWLRKGNFKKGFEAQDTDVTKQMFALQSPNGKAVLNANTLKQQAAKEKQDDYMMMARPDLYSDKELASRAAQLLKIALHDLNNYHSTEFQMPTRSATGNFDVSAKGKVDWIKEAEENISRAYSMIRNDKILAMVKKEMGNNYNLLLQREHEHLKTDNLKNITTITDTQVTEYSDKEGKVKLTPEQIAHNKYIVTWLKSQLADLEREKKFNEAKEGWKQDFVNNTRELLFGGVTRASLADKYNLIKSNMTRLEAAAEGKLLDANGKPVSFEDAMKNLGETGIQVLEQANQDYQTEQATGEFMVDMAVLAIPIPGLSIGNIVRMSKTLYKIVGTTGKMYKVVKVSEEAAKGQKILNYVANEAKTIKKATSLATKAVKEAEKAEKAKKIVRFAEKYPKLDKVLKLADSSATGAMHMELKTAALEATNIATSREGFTSDRISEMNEKIKGSGKFGGMGGFIGGSTGMLAEYVSSTGAKYVVHGLGLVTDITAAAGLMTAESNGETNFWDNLRCINPDGSFNFEQASMTAMMIYGHLRGAATIKGKPMPKAEIQADGTVKYTLNNRELVLSKDGIFTDSETGRKFKLATNKNSKTELAELTKKEIYNSRQKTEVKDGMTLEDFRKELKNNDLRGNVYTKADGGRLVVIKHSFNKYELYEFDTNNKMISQKSVKGKSAIKESYPEFANAESSGTIGSTSGYLGMNKTGRTGNKTNNVETLQDKVNLKKLITDLKITHTQENTTFTLKTEEGIQTIIEKNGKKIIKKYLLNENNKIKTELTIDKNKVTDIKAYNEEGQEIELTPDEKAGVIKGFNKQKPKADKAPGEKSQVTEPPVKPTESEAIQPKSETVATDKIEYVRDENGNIIKKIHKKEDRTIETFFDSEGNVLKSDEIVYGSQGLQKTIHKNAQGKIVAIYDNVNKQMLFDIRENPVIASESEAIQTKQKTETNKPAETDPTSHSERSEESQAKAEPKFSESNINFSRTHEGFSQIDGNTKDVPDLRNADSFRNSKDGVGVVYLPKENATAIVVKISGRVNDNYTIMIDGKIPEEQCRALVKSLKESGNNRFDRQQVADILNKQYEMAETNPTSNSEAPAEESQATGKPVTPKTETPVKPTEIEAIQQQNTAETKTEPKTGNTFNVSTDDIPTTLSDMQKSLEKSHENVTRIDKDKNTVIYSIKNDETGGVMHVQFTKGKRSSMTIVKANDLQTHIEFAADGKTPSKVRTDFIDNGKIFTRVEDRTTGQVAFEEPIVLNGERQPIGFIIENNNPLTKRFNEGTVNDGKFTPKEEVAENTGESNTPKTTMTIEEARKFAEKFENIEVIEQGKDNFDIEITYKDDNNQISQISKSEYKNGKLTKEIIKNAEGTTENVYKNGELAEITEYEYQNGKVVKSIKEQLKNDEVVSSTESEYNDGNLVKSTKSEYEKGELVGITESEYKDGNLVEETWVSADGKNTKITKNEYKDGTLIKSREELKTDNSTEITEKEYNDGNVVKDRITNEKGINEGEYNNGKLIKETIKDVNGKTTQINEIKYNEEGVKTKEIRTQYKDDNVVSSTEYEIDNSGYTTKETQKNADGKITQVIEREFNKNVPTKETKTQFKDGNITQVTETEYKDLNPTKEIQKDANGKITKIHDFEQNKEFTTPEEINNYIKESFEKDINNIKTQEDVEKFKTKLDEAKNKGIIAEDEYAKFVEQAEKNLSNGKETVAPENNGKEIKSPFEITADKIVVNGKEQPIPTFEEAQNTLKHHGGKEYSIEAGDGNRLILRYNDNGNFIGSREEISINGKALKDTSRNADGTLDKTIDYFHTNDGEPVLIERDSNGKPTKIKWYKRNITFNKEGKASYEVTNEKNETINKPIEEVLKDSPELKPLLEKQGIKLVEESNSPVPPVVENNGEGTPTPENNGEGEQKTPTQEEITAQQEIVNKIKNELNKIKPGLNEEQANKDLKAAEKEFDFLAEKTLKKARKIGKNVDLQTIKKALLSDEKYDSLTNKHKRIVNKYKNAKADVEAIKKQQELQNKLATEQQKLDSMQEAAKANEKNTPETNNNKGQPVTKDSLEKDINNIKTQEDVEKFKTKLDEAKNKGIITKEEYIEFMEKAREKQKAAEAAKNHADEVAEANNNEGQPVIESESESESASVNTETPTPAKPSMFDRLFHRNKVKLEKEVASGEGTIGDYKFNTVKDENGYVRTKTNKNTGKIEGKEYFNVKGKKIKTEEYYSDGKIVTEGNVTTEYYVDDDVDIVKYPNHKEVKFIYNEESYELEGAEFTEKHNPLHPKRLVVFDFTKGNTSSSTKRRTYYEYNSDKKHFELKNEKGDVVGTATFDPKTRHWVEKGQYSSDLAPKTTNISRGEGRFRIKLPERNKVPKNLRDENGNLREGVKPFNDGYTETISKGGVEITKAYDSKGTLLLEVSKEKATYYNAKGEVIAEEKPIPNGVQRTEFSKDYDLEINMKADKDRTPETAFIRYKSGPEVDAPVEFEYNKNKKVYENKSPEGTVLKTLKYDAKNHSWTIKNAKGKTIETQENRIESSHKARNFVAGTTLVGGGIALFAGGLQMIAPEKPDYPLNTESQKQTTQPTTKPKTEQPSNKVTLGDQEGTIDKNTGTITIDGTEYPKNPDDTYNINDKTYKLVEGNKLVEVVDTPDDNGETGGADPDESPEVKGTIDDKEYTIKDGKVSVDGEELTPDENEHYTIGDDKYKIEDRKLVKVEPEASAKATNSSTQTSGGSSGGSASGTTGSQSDRRTGGSASGTTGSQAGGRTDGSASGTTDSQAGGRTDGSASGTTGSQAGGRTDGSGTGTIGSQNANNQKDSSKFFEEILRQNVINDMNQKRVQPEQTIQTQDDVTTQQEPQRTEKRKITPMERMDLTEKIRRATDRNDIEKIQKEMRKYKVFPGRKNLRRAYKAKLRAITHDGEPNVQKYNKKFNKRWEKITESDVYKSDKSKQDNDIPLKKLNYVDYITNTSVDIDPNGFNA